MTDYLSRPAYSPLALSRSSALEVRAAADQIAKTTEITKAANYEVAQVGAHAVGAMATLTYGAENIRRQLTYSGYDSEVFDDAHQKLLQVTGNNLITLANTAQREILQQAAAAMR